MTKIPTWTYQNKPLDTIPDEYEGFVYLITNTTTGQKYIGKKLAKFKTTKPPLKGKKNKRRGKKESDWKDYYGSHTEIKNIIIEEGTDVFNREILHICFNKKQLTYYENKYLFSLGVIESNDYYNDNIEGRYFSKDLL